MNFQLRLFTLGLAMFALSACGKKEREQVVDVGDFAPYVQRFEQLSADYGEPVKVTDLIMKFGVLANPLERGVCEVAPETTPTVTISPAVWNRIDEAEREELVFHELGHCVLRRKHVAERDDTGVPVSLMNPIKIDGQLYEMYSRYYLEELFGRRNEF